MKLGKFEVHPTAARFPIMSKEQLAALTEDIKKNGLIEPIFLQLTAKHWSMAATATPLARKRTLNRNSINFHRQCPKLKSLISSAPRIWSAVT